MLRRAEAAAIPVCDAWRKSVDRFLADTGRQPSPDHVLILVDRSAGYRPGNVRWVSKSERQQFVAHARRIRFRGQEMSLSAWARELGILPATLRDRLSRMPVEKALSTGERIAPESVAQSRRKSSRHKWVYHRKSDGRWEARYKLDGRLLYLGIYPKEAQAAAAVTRKQIEVQAEKTAATIRRRHKSRSREWTVSRLRGLVDDVSTAVNTTREAGLRPEKRRRVKCSSG